MFDAGRLGPAPEETVLFLAEKLDLKDCRNMWTPQAVAMMALLIRTPQPRLDNSIFSWSSTLPICKIVLVLQNRFDLQAFCKFKMYPFCVTKGFLQNQMLENPVFLHVQF